MESELLSALVLHTKSQSVVHLGENGAEIQMWVLGSVVGICCIYNGSTCLGYCKHCQGYILVTMVTLISLMCRATIRVSEF